MENINTRRSIEQLQKELAGSAITYKALDGYAVRLSRIGAQVSNSLAAAFLESIQADR